VGVGRTVSEGGWRSEAVAGERNFDCAQYGRAERKISLLGLWCAEKIEVYKVMHLEVLLHEEKRFHRPLADNLAVHDTVAIALAQQHIFLCLAVDSPRNIR
jgi:Holliday junction resolvasome RuvABC endonuclease subunit